MSRTQEKITQPTKTTYAGIDVGKNYLDIFVHPSGVQLQVKNDHKSIQSLAKKLLKQGVQLATLEATSKYHCLAHSVLHDAGVPVSVVNPFRSRQFADSMGNSAKTDKIDAQSLAHFAERMRPEPSAPPEKHIKALHELHTARRQAADEVADLKRQLQTADHSLVIKQIKVRIKLGEQHKEALNEEIQSLIVRHTELKSKFDILTSIPGIGSITAAILLADLSELGQTNAKEIAALAGVAPMNWDSGAKHGHRMIRGGRRCVRNALYMCAVASVRRSNSLGAYYRRLIKRGKHPKVALTAVMRKLVIIANALITENRKWEIDCPEKIHRRRRDRPSLA